MSKTDGGFVYILASKPNGTLYVGVSNDIVRRIHQHSTGEGSDFVNEHDVTRLVHLEHFDDIERAIRREKQLKAWKREWKLGLIRDNTPKWRDLYAEACRAHVAQGLRERRTVPLALRVPGEVGSGRGRRGYGHSHFSFPLPHVRRRHAPAQPRPGAHRPPHPRRGKTEISAGMRIGTSIVSKN